MMNLWLPPAVLTERANLADKLGKPLQLADGRVLRWRQREDHEWAGGGSWTADPKRRERRGLHIIASVDNTERWGPLLHVSFSYERHLPSWADVKTVKATFFGPDRDAMMVLPCEADYVNLHPFTMHLWECPEHWGLR